MIEKVNIKHLLLVGAICLAINFLFVGFGKPATTISRLQNDVNSTMGAVKAESGGIAVEIERSQDAGSKAQEAIGRINDKINGSRARINEIRTGINTLEQLLGECEELARESKNIINGIDGANRSRT